VNVALLPHPCAVAAFSSPVASEALACRRRPTRSCDDAPCHPLFRIVASIRDGRLQTAGADPSELCIPRRPSLVHTVVSRASGCCCSAALDSDRIQMSRNRPMAGGERTCTSTHLVHCGFRRMPPCTGTVCCAPPPQHAVPISQLPPYQTHKQCRRRALSTRCGVYWAGWPKTRLEQAPCRS
jgi:hypothetical protein